MLNCLDYNSVIIGNSNNRTGDTAKVQYDRCIDIGSQNSHSQSQSIVIGSSSCCRASRSVSIGHTSQNFGYRSISIGSSVTVGEFNSEADSESVDPYNVAIGNMLTAKGDGNVVIGKGSYATENTSNGTKPQNTIVLGNQLSTSNKNCISIGSMGGAHGDYTVSIGNSTYAYASHSIVIGDDANNYNNASNSITLGYGSAAKDANVLSIGYGEENTSGYPVTRRIVNVGTPTADTDAATKSYVDGKTGITKIDLGISSLSGSSKIGFASSVQTAVSDAIAKSSFPYCSCYLTASVKDGADTSSVITWVCQSNGSAKSGTGWSLNFEHMQGIELSDGSMPSISIASDGITPSGNIKANQYTKFELVVKG